MELQGTRSLTSPQAVNGSTHEKWPLGAWKGCYFLQFSLTVSSLSSTKLEAAKKAQDPTKSQSGELPLVAQWTHWLMALGVLRSEPRCGGRGHPSPGTQQHSPPQTERQKQLPCPLTDGWQTKCSKTYKGTWLSLKKK